MIYIGVPGECGKPDRFTIVYVGVVKICGKQDNRLHG